jgi:Mg2+-importing ATPase
LSYGYLNSALQSGLQNALDEAIIAGAGADTDAWRADVRVVDEVPFDFERRRLTVVVDRGPERMLICKGAVEEMLTCCTHVVSAAGPVPLTPERQTAIEAVVAAQNRDGYRLMAVATKILRQTEATDYAIADEADLVLRGFLTFLDPPKQTAAAALTALAALHVDVKILTGDSEAIAQYICTAVGLPGERMLLGSQIAQMDPEQLKAAVAGATLFAKLTPDQKERIIRALQQRGHTVGFLGDGINDAPALKAADVGISVDSAADIAKESSDIILLEQDLGVLEQGVREGRKVFGNIIKYIRMAASSNFGNMFSMLGASAMLTFVPMKPIQILLNNLLYDISQTAIPSDAVDPEWMAYPRKWEIGKLQQYILMIGPMSTLFDIITFVVLLYGFNAGDNPTFFQTAWFIESIFSQTLVIHVIRTDKLPFVQSMASWPLMLSSFAILAVAAWLTVSPFAEVLGFVALPWSFWLVNFALLVAYIPLTQVVKVWYLRRYGDAVAPLPTGTPAV